MNNTSAVFFVGSGRCGTFQITKSLEADPSFESHHEFHFEPLLKQGLLHYYGLSEVSETRRILRESIGSSIHYSEKENWADCSNALPWVVDCLASEFPRAKFVFLVRDGRKVVTSFFHKFEELVYPTRQANQFLSWFRNRDEIPPPPLKTYWRPVPREPVELEIFEKWSRFERLCWYWSEVNRVALCQFADVSDERVKLVKFEDLCSDPDERAALRQFVGVREDSGALQSFDRPVNVGVPKNFTMSPEQESQFNEICSGIMSELGYAERDTYNVSY